MKRAVVGAELADLAAHVFEVFGEVVARRVGHQFVMSPAVWVGRVVPVDHRVVGDQRQRAPVALFGEHAEHVASERGPGHVEVGEAAVEHTEAVVVFGGEDQIFEPVLLNDVQPAARIEGRRAEVLRVAAILLPRSAIPPQFLFVDAADGVDAPVYE